MTLVPAFEIGIWNAWIFMAVFIGYVLVISAIFRSTRERVAHGKERKRVLRLFAPLILIMIVYSIFLPLVRGTGWFYAGAAIFLAGLVILLLARSDADATPEGKPFTGGIYHFSRHPVYLGYILVFIGTGIASASWLFLVLAVVFILNAHFVMVTEEDSTQEKYGEAYTEYLKKTPKWIGMPKKSTE